jgi:hypothetical protein
VAAPAGTPKGVSRHQRLVRSGALKLQKHGTLMALSREESVAARRLVDEAISFVQQYCVDHPRTKKMPRVFSFRKARYFLEYSSLGRLYVRVPATRARFASAPFQI